MRQNCTEPGETAIFNLVREPRSGKTRIWCLAVGVAVNLSLVTALQISARVYAIRHASDRLLLLLSREMQVVLLDPPLPAPAETPSAAPEVAPTPLTVPDPRLLSRLDSRVADFVRDNPAIEAVVTREIVRDLDSGVLDTQRLLRRTHLEVRLEIDGDGNVARERITRSTRVPSLDHLALELAKLLPKYLDVEFLKMLTRIVASVRIEDRVEIQFRGDVRQDEDPDEVRKQVQNAITLLRFALADGEAAFLLRDVSLTVEENRVTVGRSYEKDPLVAFLMRYYSAETPSKDAKPGVPPPR